MQILHSLKNIKISKLLRGKISHVLKQQVGKVTSLTRVMLTDPPFNFDKICLFGDQILLKGPEYGFGIGAIYVPAVSTNKHPQLCLRIHRFALQMIFSGQTPIPSQHRHETFSHENKTHESDLQTNNNGCFSVTSNEPTRDPRDTGLSESAMDIEDLASFSGAMLGPRVMYMIMQ